MRIIVSGGRNFFAYPIVQLVLDRIKITELAHGGAVGADGLAGAYAKANDIPLKVYKADWENLSHPDAVIKTRRDGRQYDAKEGLRRNERMLKDFNPDLVVFFPGGAGTAHMKKICVDNCKMIMVYNNEGQLIEI